ncbi:polyhydroxyalkanoic acid system family protein [Scleromatobacter humisilvae]|uniref:Polyhydroxyalkanoic acid system family protein n=1 Tax=Scleromatobacter humisilvae TaxID=2897159 RepID=A0A9X1YMM1_9BURK|nr:polyhydroxyalkanoic acid system family protein [Scleromatobacter humisilvae]MCK9688958.1 polyhydroxyalkanoic acid system family protein [Scleromatobacter humisilvae]
MADLNLHRDHTLGLARARKVALKWAEDVEEKLDMECTIIEGDDEDVLEFRRSGVDGRMVVAATFFDLEAKLGFLLKPFVGQIEAEVRKQLDEALAKELAKAARPAAKPAKPAAKATRKK